MQRTADKRSVLGNTKYILVGILERVRCGYSPPDPSFLMNSKLSREICSSGAPRSANSEMERKDM